MLGKNTIGHASAAILTKAIAEGADQPVLPDYRALDEYRSEGGYALLADVLLTLDDLRLVPDADNIVPETSTATSQPDAGPKHNSVLIASRRGIDRSWAFDRDGLDPRHLWCAEIDGVVLCGVYMPQRTEKLPYWEALIGDARRDGVDLLVGDFNTGNNDLDKDPQGAKFIGPEMPGRLTATGYTDVWRSLHPAAREYSWFSRPGDNGFRLDYLFAVPDLARQVSACTFDHAPRITGETDHSGLVASLG